MSAPVLGEVEREGRGEGGWGGWAPPFPAPFQPLSNPRPHWFASITRYNALAAVPHQLERFAWFGLAVCADCWLGAVALLPLRAGSALVGALTGTRPLDGAGLYDILCAGITAAAGGLLCALPAGAVYFWMKDLTQEFLKLHVIYAAVEIFDKARRRAAALHGLGAGWRARAVVWLAAHGR